MGLEIHIDKESAHRLSKRSVLIILSFSVILIGISALLELAGNTRGYLSNSHQNWLQITAGCLTLYAIGFLFATIFSIFLNCCPTSIVFYAAPITKYVPHYFWIMSAWALYNDWPVFANIDERIEDGFLFMFLVVVANSVRAVWLRYTLRNIIHNELFSLSKEVASIKLAIYMLTRAVSSSSTALQSTKFVAAGGGGLSALTPCDIVPERIAKLRDYTDAEEGNVDLMLAMMPSVRIHGFYVDASLAKEVLSTKRANKAMAKAPKSFRKVDIGVAEVASSKDLLKLSAHVYERLMEGIGMEAGEDGPGFGRVESAYIPSSEFRGNDDTTVVSGAGAGVDDFGLPTATPMEGKELPSSDDDTASLPPQPPPYPPPHPPPHQTLFDSSFPTRKSSLAFLSHVAPPKETEQLKRNTYVHSLDLGLLVGKGGAAGMKVFDPNNDTRITKKEFMQGVEECIRKWELLTRSWFGGHATVSRALSLSSGAALVVICCIVFLLVFNLSVGEVLLPLGTFAVALSFALGAAIADAVRSLVFLIGYKPYELEDRVRVEGVHGGKPCFVHSIDMLTTTFRALNGELFQYSNSLLSTKAIFNHRRSTNVLLLIRFKVASETTSAQLAAIKEAALEYLKARPLRWRAAVELLVIDSHPAPEGVLEFEIRIPHLFPWQQGTRIADDQGMFVVAMCRVMDTLGMKYYRPRQPVSLVEDDHEPKEDFASLSGLGHKPSFVKPPLRPNHSMSSLPQMAGPPRSTPTTPVQWRGSSRHPPVMAVPTGEGRQVGLPLSSSELQPQPPKLQPRPPQAPPPPPQQQPAAEAVPDTSSEEPAEDTSAPAPAPSPAAPAQSPTGVAPVTASLSLFAKPPQGSS